MLAAVVQARMGSSRLPGKVMAEIEGKPMLQRFIERVRAARRVEEVIIATTTEPRDDAIADFARSQNLKCYRGSETDVLDRFFQAAQSFGVSDLVRVTSDCPLIDPAVIDRVIEAYRAGGYDYVSNTQGGRFPDGMDVEVFSFEALRRSHKEAVWPSEREHVTPHMKASSGFRVGRVESPADYSEYKWSVDNDRDMEFVRAVYRRLGDRPFRMEEILALVQGSPELAALCRGAIVNEGYYRSIAQEPAMLPHPRRLDRSQALKERAKPLIPGEAQTFSKGPTQFVQGVAPAFVSRGDGCRLWDVDGNEYLDCTMALGAVLLGYGDSDVNDAVKRQIEEGVSLSLPHPLEVEVAETLRELIPCAEMVRFGKNGSDVTSGAVRLARAFTGRDLIAHCYDEQTEILTVNGFKLIKQVARGEVVATLNSVTQAMEYQPVLETFTHPYQGELLLFEGRRLSLCVTPEHRIYHGYRLKNGLKKFQLTEAWRLKARRSPIRMTCASKWNCESPETFTLPAAQIKGWKTKGVANFPVAPFLRFLGWYLTEGSVTIRHPGTPGRYSHYRISLAQFDKRNGLVQRMQETIRTLGFTPRQEGHHITFDSKELALYLKDFGHAADKRLPSWVKSLSPQLLSILLDALVDGDGTRSDGRVRFYTSSRRLADDVQELMLKTGKAAYVAERKNNGFARGKPIYHVTTSNRTTFECKTVRRVAYQGNVYCVSVPNGIVLVRRKGRCVWSGNSGYHGWQDWYIGSTTRNKGVPRAIRELTIPFEYNRIESLKRIFEKHPGKLAAVIMEPVGVVEPTPGFLSEVRELCRREGALLIFDEVLTGVRFGLGGAGERFGVVPDLACFGKGLANGFPLSALVGRRKIMVLLEEVFFSFTFGGELAALAAARACLKKLREGNGLSQVWAQGQRLKDGTNVMSRHFGLEAQVQCVGLAPRTVVQFGDKDEPESLRMKSLFQQECLKRGVLFTGVHLPSVSHGQREVDQVLRVYRSALEELASALRAGNLAERLEGKPVQPVFRRA